MFTFPSQDKSWAIKILTYEILASRGNGYTQDLLIIQNVVLRI